MGRLGISAGFVSMGSFVPGARRMGFRFLVCGARSFFISWAPVGHLPFHIKNEAPSDTFPAQCLQSSPPGLPPVSPRDVLGAGDFVNLRGFQGQHPYTLCWHCRQSGLMR